MAHAEAEELSLHHRRIRERGTNHDGLPALEQGRLALQTGAPIVPVAIRGSERARRGWLVRPVRVDLRFGRPLTYPPVEAPSLHLAVEVTARIWPCVELQWAWLGGPMPHHAEHEEGRERAAA